MTALFALRGHKEVAEALLKSVKIKTKAACECVSWLHPAPATASRPFGFAFCHCCRCHTIMRTTVPGNCCCNYVAGCKTNCQQRRRTRASKKTKERVCRRGRTKTTTLPGRTQIHALGKNPYNKLKYIFSLKKGFFLKL